MHRWRSRVLLVRTEVGKTTSGSRFTCPCKATELYLTAQGPTAQPLYFQERISGMLCTAAAGKLLGRVLAVLLIKEKKKKTELETKWVLIQKDCK